MNAVAQSKIIERDFSQFTKKYPFVFTIKSKVQHITGQVAGSIFNTYYLNRDLTCNPADTNSN